jgi:hypothetical protein
VISTSAFTPQQLSHRAAFYKERQFPNRRFRFVVVTALSRRKHASPLFNVCYADRAASLQKGAAL